MDLIGGGRVVGFGIFPLDARKNLLFQGNAGIEWDNVTGKFGVEGRIEGSLTVDQEVPAA